MKPGMAVFVVALCIHGVGCTTDDAPIDAVATDSVVATIDPEISPHTGTQVNQTNNDPFGIFTVEAATDVATTVLTTPVWLINESPQAMIVTANGGAESVVVDTLEAADSVLVSIDSRARSIELTARTLEGRPGGTVRLPMDSETKRAAFPR